MKTKQIFKIIGNTVLWLIFALALLAVVLSFSSTGEVPNVFGTGYLSVQTDSMQPEFNPGDLIIVKTTKTTDLFEVDDIVTFRTIIEGKPALNTHRIISYITIGEIRYYSTQGDNVSESDLGTVTAGDIVAKYTGVRLKSLGNIMDYVQSSIGFLICIVLPLAAIFIYQLVNFVIILSKYKEDEKKNAKINMEHLTDEQKEEIAKKYLESLNAKKEDK